MAVLPIEVLATNSRISARLSRVLDIANSVQTDLHFSFCKESGLLEVAAFVPAGELLVSDFLNQIEAARATSRGFHPFIIAFTDSYLSGNKFVNLFGSARSERGVAVVTFCQVDEIVGPDSDSHTGYALYYLARYGMGFISPTIKNHDDPRQCIYDRKISKRDIIDSMRSGALCDKCRAAIWASGKGSRSQMDSIDRLIEHASSLIHKTAIARRPNVFIASSSKNLPRAIALKGLLGSDFRVQVWNEDEVFRLGTATIEQLEQHVHYYDFGIFLMLPDDQLIREGLDKMVPRDNVVFEAGLFTGKLSRHRAIVLSARDDQVLLPTDLSGLTTVQVDYNGPLPDSLRQAATRISTHMKRVFGEGQ